MQEVFHAQDRKPNGTPGQSFTGGVFETCHMNTVLENTVPDMVLSGNEIIAPGGRYLVWATNCGPAGSKQLAVCDVTSGAALPDAVLVESVRNPSAGPASSLLTTLQGSFFLPDQRKIKLMLDSPGGAAPASGMTGDEVYSDIFLVRIGG